MWKAGLLHDRPSVPIISTLAHTTHGSVASTLGTKAKEKGGSNASLSLRQPCCNLNQAVLDNGLLQPEDTTMIQAIINLYPDFINEFGLLGCTLFTIWCMAAVTCLIGDLFFLRRAYLGQPRTIYCKGRHGSSYRAF